MNLTLKNESGLVRSVPTGLSWTGFIFTGFTMLTRAMLAKGLIYMAIIYGLQAMTLFAQMVVTASQGEEAGRSAGGIDLLLLSIPNFIFLFKLNKWTVRHWLDRGYKPEGPGWVQWGPRFGISTSDELKVDASGSKDEPFIRAKDVLGFIFAGLIIFIIIVSSFGGGEETGNTRSSARQSKPAASTESEARLREIVRFSDSNWALMEARNLGSVLPGGFEPKRTRGKFVQVCFRVTNTTEDEETVLFAPTLRDARGRVFQQMDGQEMYLPEGADSMTLEQLPAGLKKEFYAIYEVPDDAVRLQFQARSLADRGEIRRIATGL
jgi:hypothetical protein